MPGALAGTMVVDCSSGTAGPLTTGQLADHGATVCRVEPPGHGSHHADIAYAVYNRGKQSLCLDLEQAAGRAVLERLLEQSDVFVESWQPGVSETLGLDWESLHARFPRLVYCSISGYGQPSPENERPGREALVLARLGMMGAQSGVREPPIFFGSPMAGYGAGFLAAIGITAALYRRGSDGEGRRVDTSLADGALSLITMTWLQSEHPMALNRLEPTRRIVVASMLCGDGEYLGVHTSAAGAHRRLMEVVGLSDRIAAAKGPVEMAEPLTAEEGAIVASEMPRIFAGRPRDEWLRALIAADVCAIPVLRPGEVFDQPQARHNQMAVELNDPELGRVTQVGVAAKLSATPGSVRGPAPRAGEHTEPVLLSAGLSPAEIEALRRDGIVS